MSMLIRIECGRSKNGNPRAGWLILEYGPNANVFHVDDRSKTDQEIQKLYGGIIKTTIRVGGVEYTRLSSKGAVVR